MKDWKPKVYGMYIEVFNPHICGKRSADASARDFVTDEGLETAGILRYPVVFKLHSRGKRFGD